MIHPNIFFSGKQENSYKNVLFFMESGEIKSRSPYSTATDTFYCLWPAAVGFLGLPGSKMYEFLHYFITVQASDEYQMSLTSHRQVGKGGFLQRMTNVGW